MKRATVILIVLATFGCVDGYNSNVPYVAWETPSPKDKLYRPDVKPGATALKLSYTTPPTIPTIYFNGHNVTECFHFFALGASADLFCMEGFSKQGTNKLQLNPLEIGPVVEFLIDTEGPEVEIIEVCYPYTMNCTVDPPPENHIYIKMRYCDPSNVTYREINGIPIMGDSIIMQMSELYIFKTFDENGYMSIHEYQPNGQALSLLQNSF